MLNNVVLVGRIVKKPELKKSENGKINTIITIAVPRSFKNVDGVYDTDFINCTCWDSVANSVHDYCNNGDVLCVKGRLSTRIETDGEVNKNKLEVIAERVTFLSTRAKENI